MAEPFIEVKADDFAADMICLQNGVLNLHDFKLYAHSPQYFLTWMMDVNYSEPVETGAPGNLLEGPEGI